MAPTSLPTRQPTPGPTRKPTPKPTPAGPANLGKLTIVDNGDGTYTFSWPEYTGEGFMYYKLVYGDWGTTPNYPASPFWACNDSRDDSSWTGPVDVGDYAVRVQVVDESKGIVIRAQTGIVHLNVTQPAPTAPPVQSLGALGVTDDGGGNYTFTLGRIHRRLQLRRLQAGLGGLGRQPLVSRRRLLRGLRDGHDQLGVDRDAVRRLVGPRPGHRVVRRQHGRLRPDRDLPPDGPAPR